MESNYFLRPVRVTFVICALLTLSACDDNTIGVKKFEIREARGDVYLINQVTGQAFIRDRGRLVELKRYDEAKLLSLSQARKRFTPAIKGLIFDVSTKFRNGSLYYKIFVEGQRKRTDKPEDAKDELVDPDWKSYWSNGLFNHVNVNFIDTDGFAVAAKVLDVGSGLGEGRTRIVDDKEETRGYEYEGSIEMDVADYEAIQKVNVTYNLKKPTDQPKPK
jgi:hypothetical protein